MKIKLELRLHIVIFATYYHTSVYSQGVCPYNRVSYIVAYAAFLPLVVCGPPYRPKC